MSLEAAIEKMTAAIEANTAVQQEVIGLSKSIAAGDTEKPKKAAADKPKKADAAAAATGVSPELKVELGNWLGEFAKEEDKDNPDGAHREVKARKTALKTAFEKLGVTKLGEITDADKVGKLAGWLEKAKAKGRLDPDPEPTADDDDGLGMD